MKTGVNGDKNKSNSQINLQTSRRITKQSRNTKKEYKIKEGCLIRKNSFSFYCEQLQNMNIVLCNERGNNVLHDIATFIGRRKCIALDRILNLVKENKIPKSNLVIAANTKNRCSATPIQRAIMLKLIKKQHSILTLKDSTIVFCKQLLKNGANPECLELSSKFIANCNLKLYHHFLNDLARSLKLSKSASQDLKDYVTAKISQITGLSERRVGQTRTKRINSIVKKGIKNTEKTIKGTWKAISPAKSTRNLVISTAATVLSIMMIVAFFQGQVTLMTALFVIGVMTIGCIALNLSLAKHCKKTCNRLFIKKEEENKDIVIKKEYISESEIYSFSEFGVFQRKVDYSDEDIPPQTKINVVEVTETIPKKVPDSLLV